ncbi:MAG: hypothetical protein RI897_1642 [Verrucomicrobiota bacterium]
MCRMCVNKSVPATPGARLVVSDNGDILSPKYAPETIAPATIGNGTPNPRPTPIKAIPTVPTVPHDDPVPRETTEHTKTAATKKYPGEKIFSP